MRAVGSYSDSKINKLETRYRAKIKSPAQLLAQSKRKKIGKRDIDLELVRRLATIMCNQQEIGAVLGIGQSGVGVMLESWPEFAQAIEEGYAQTRQTLRRTQLDLALSGHASMLMWLGKQYLGQSDQHKIETKSEINITVQRAMDELRNIPRDQLLAAQALLSGPVINQESASEGNDEGG